MPFPSRFTLPVNVVVPRVEGFPVGAVMRKAYWPFSVAFDAVPGIRTEALALFVGSLTEVAVMVRLPPDGAMAGAVKVVMAPLAVEVGLKLPQADAGVQLQFTPPLALSLLTVAATFAVPPAARNAGGIEDSATEIGCGPGP